MPFLKSGNKFAPLQLSGTVADSNERLQILADRSDS